MLNNEQKKAIKIAALGLAAQRCVEKAEALLQERREVGRRTAKGSALLEEAQKLYKLRDKIRRDINRSRR